MKEVQEETNKNVKLLKKKTKKRIEEISSPKSSMVEEEDDEMMTMITKAKAAPGRSRKAFNAVKMLMEENFSVETIQNS